MIILSKPSQWRGSRHHNGKSDLPLKLMEGEGAGRMPKRQKGVNPESD